MSRWEAARRAVAALRSLREEPPATPAQRAWVWAGEAGAVPGAPRPEQRRNVSRGRRGRGSTRAAGWGSRWAASGRLRGSSSHSRAGSGAAAQPGPRAAGGTRWGVPQMPASTSSPSTITLPAVWRMDLRETRLEAVVQVRSVGIEQSTEGKTEKRE